MAFFYTPAGQFPKKIIHTFLMLAFTVYLAGLALLPLHNARATPAADVWLSVDTNKLNLTVMQGDATLKVFENIAIGSNGPSMNKQRDDQTTPLGEFTITEIRRSQRYQVFMAINYPNLDHTERAFHDHRIDASEYRALRYDLDRGRPPPQNTTLGGQLGIHGLGTGDLAVHETVNWTNGCIALTNEQLLELSGWVAVGTRVVVL